MLNTSSCTRHMTLPFPSITPSTPADNDFTSFYGNLYPGDAFGGDMSVLDELFSHEVYPDLSTLDSSGMKERAINRSIADNIDLPPSSSSSSSQKDAGQFDNALVSSPVESVSQSNDEGHIGGGGGGDYNAVVCNSSCDGAFEPFNTTNSSTNGDTKRSPIANSVEDSLFGDPDKRSRIGQGILAPRGKGRPVKSAQTLSASNGCKPIIQCFTCHKTFNNSSALAKHKLIHSEDRKYSCPICSKSFKRQDHLHGHMMTHSAKKPYECCFARCDKSYCDARSLRRHHENHHFQLMESGQRDFGGDGKTFDPSTFKDSNHWTTGFNPLDEPKPVKCSVCGKRFRNLPALNGHMRLHGGYMRQVKSEIPEVSDVDKDVISESLETSCASFSSEDASDHTATKIPESMNIKQEHSNDHYWNNNNTQNWCKSDGKYPNSTPLGSSCSNDSSMNQFFHPVEGQDPRCEPTNNACFYSTGQATFQNEALTANIAQAKMATAAPHPSLSSPCLAISPPSTPGHIKQCYTNAPYNSKFFRRAVTPICHSNIMNSSFVPNKCQQNIHRSQNHPSNLQRATSVVFPQGHPQSPFATNTIYTPASATTPNYFQFPSSYEDSSAMSPSSSHNPYAHQYPSTSPFLNIQSRPRTPFTPNTPGRRQFYYNHGEESPLTPSMRGYGRKTPTYHPYHSNYRYYPQLKHHSSAQTFSNVDSDFNKCLEMLEKGNINSMTANHSSAGNNMSMCSMSQFGSKQADDNMMDFTPSDPARDLDLNCLVEEASFCASLDQISTSEWTATNQTQSNYGIMDQNIKNDLCNPVFHGSNSTFRQQQQDMKSCNSFNNMNNNLRNNNTFKDASTGNQINHFAMNAYDFAQSQQNAFSAPVHRDGNLHQIDPLPIDKSINHPSTQTNEKRKKKHKPEPLWIPANVSNFADTGGCFIDIQNDCDQSGLANCRKKAPPPPYICITPIGAAPCQGNPTNQILPNSAPPFHDFSLDLSDSINSGLNGF